MYLASMKRAGKVEAVAERNKRNNAKGHAKRYGKGKSDDVRSPDIVSLDTPAAQAEPERAAHEALYLASMKRTGKIETIAERRAKNGEKGGRGNKRVESTVRSPDSAFDNTPAAQAEPEPELERKTAVERKGCRATCCQNGISNSGRSGTELPKKHQHLQWVRER